MVHVAATCGLAATGRSACAVAEDQRAGENLRSEATQVLVGEHVIGDRVHDHPMPEGVVFHVLVDGPGGRDAPLPVG
jgi:hypothetical protein